MLGYALDYYVSRLCLDDIPRGAKVRSAADPLAELRSPGRARFCCPVCSSEVDEEVDEEVDGDQWARSIHAVYCDANWNASYLLPKSGDLATLKMLVQRNKSLLLAWKDFESRQSLSAEDDAKGAILAEYEHLEPWIQRRVISVLRSIASQDVVNCCAALF